MNQILTGVFSGIVSAGAASLVVVLFTTARLRKERAFDRRLEWCESMMRAINAAGAAVSSASTGDDPGGREGCWSETIRHYENLIPLCGLKEIYASEDAVLEIQDFMCPSSRRQITVNAASVPKGSRSRRARASRTCAADPRRRLLRSRPPRRPQQHAEYEQRQRDIGAHHPLEHATYLSTARFIRCGHSLDSGAEAGI